MKNQSDEPQLPEGMTIEEALDPNRSDGNGLTLREAQVLYWKLDGQNYVRIGSRFDLTSYSVEGIVRSIFDKLGLGSKTITRDEKNRRLQTYYRRPFLEKIDRSYSQIEKIYGVQKDPELVKDDPEPIKDESKSIKDEIKAKPGEKPEPVGQVVEQPPPLVEQPKEPEKPIEQSVEQKAQSVDKNRLRITILSGVVGMAVLALLVFLGSSFFRTNLLPSVTSTPTSILDEFTTVLGKPQISNGAITASETTLLSMGNTSWKDYEVEFDVTTYSTFVDPNGGDFIAVRVTDVSNMLLYAFGQIEGRWYEVQNGEWVVVPGTESGQSNNFVPAKAHFRVVVKGNEFTLYIGIKQINSFINNDHPTGYVMLRIHPESIYENFQVKQLP